MILPGLAMGLRSFTFSAGTDLADFAARSISGLSSARCAISASWRGKGYVALGSFASTLETSRMPSSATRPRRLSSKRQIFMAGYSSGMKLCVFGAGAVGGHIAAKLAAAGNDVSVIARGVHLEAIKTRGLKLLHGDKTIAARVRAAANAADLEKQDAVFVTLKANMLGAFAAQCAPL